MELSECIERLYSTSAGYDTGRLVVGCPCCVNLEESELISKRPLRELSADDLDRYATKVMTTWRDEADYMRFLPRILEAAASEEGFGLIGLEFDRIISKLFWAGWEDWREEEREAVRQYFEVLWTRILLAPQPYFIQDLVGAMVRLAMQDRLVNLCAHHLSTSAAQSLEEILQFTRDETKKKEDSEIKALLLEWEGDHVRPEGIGDEELEAKHTMDRAERALKGLFSIFGALGGQEGLALMLESAKRELKGGVDNEETPDLEA